MLHYTYLHSRASDGKPFYVGKGVRNRAWSHKNRNPHWQRTVAKHGVIVEILAKWPTEQEALDHEIFLIKCLKCIGHSLVNMTEGGQGKYGWKPSPETRKLWSEQRSGALNHRYGKKGEMHHAFGRPLSEEHKKKLSLALSGERGSYYGRSHSESAKMAISKKKTGVALRSKWRKIMCIETGVVFDSIKLAAAWASGDESKHANIIRSAKSLGAKVSYGYHWKYV